MPRPPRLRAARLTNIVLATTATALVLSPMSAAAQQAITVEAAVIVRNRFLLDLDEVQRKVMALAEAFPAEMYSWRPAPDVRSVGEVFMHVANEYYVYVPMAFGAAPSKVVDPTPEGSQQFEAASTKADALTHLKTSFAYARQAIAEVNATTLAGTPNLFGRNRTIVEAALITNGELHEHLGQLIAYARVNGVRPPWSR